MTLTIAIPTFNGAERLPLVFDRLRSQVDVDGISWDVLVIDNNSSDRTAEVVQRYQNQQYLPVELRYCFEAKQGLAFARQKAIEAATGELVAFLDDDNLPAKDWIHSLISFAQSYPSAGAFGGQIHGVFEVTPPEHFHSIRAFLAIREQGDRPFQFQAEQLRLPPGAGLVVRRDAWLKSVPNQLKLSGRVGRSLTAGEDYEALLHLHKAGWQIWYCPTMHLDHLISASRLNRDYLIRLAYSTGLATCQLKLTQTSFVEKLIIFPKTLFGSCRRLVAHYFAHRNVIKTQLNREFELYFYYGSIMSSFYALKRLFGS